MFSNDIPTTSALIAVAGAALVTYSFRLGGLLMAERLPRSPAFRAFMQALPGTILLSLVAPGILTFGPGGCIAAAATAITAVKTRQLLPAMLVGMTVVLVQRHFLAG